VHPENSADTKTLAHPENSPDTKNLAYPKSLADAKNLAHPKPLADAKNLVHPKSLADPTYLCCVWVTIVGKLVVETLRVKTNINNNHETYNTQSLLQ
jgi:hypothetical protein